MKLNKQLFLGCSLALAYFFLATLTELIFFTNGSFMDALLSRTNPSLGFSRIFAAAAIIAFSGIQGLLHRRILKSDTQPVIDQLKANNEIGQPAIFEMLAHQLKTSLTTIIGFSRILNSNAVSEKMQKNYVEYIFTSSNNLLQTYNNLTYMHKLENDEIFVKSEICSIYQIFEDAYHKSSEKLIGSQSKIKLSLSVSEADRALTLSIDRKKLEMIVNNLLDTVLYFPERGTIVFGYLVEKEDEIKIFFNGSNGKLSLRNFEEAFNNYKHRSKGIDPFFDLSSLRMMVTKGIIELLGGKLWSVPNERTGISFNIALPLVKRLKTVYRESDGMESPPDWSGICILIAEDIETNYLLLKEFLKPTHAQLIWARNGREAVDIYRKEGYRINLVLLDIIMPELDGFEVAAELRKRKTKVPIIGQTAYTLENERDFTKLNNFDDYLTKPIWNHELINTLSKHIES